MIDDNDGKIVKGDEREEEGAWCKDDMKNEDGNEIVGDDGEADVVSNDWDEGNDDEDVRDKDDGEMPMMTVKGEGMRSE